KAGSLVHRDARAASIGIIHYSSDVVLHTGVGDQMSKGQRAVGSGSIRRTVLTLVMAVLAAPVVACAATIVDWKPGPTSVGIPEFSWTGFQLVGAPGITSNGDGTLPRPTQTAPGLDMETPFIIPGVPGSVIDPVANTTLFY